jgi:hypothetical protein
LPLIELAHTSSSTHELRLFLPLLFIYVTLTCSARLCSSTSVALSLPKMLSGANAFEISDIERRNIGAHQRAFRT